MRCSRCSWVPAVSLLLLCCANGDLTGNQDGRQDTLFRPRPSQSVFADSSVTPLSGPPEPPSSSWTASTDASKDHMSSHDTILPSLILTTISESANSASKLTSSQTTFDVSASWGEDVLSRNLIIASPTFTTSRTFWSNDNIMMSLMTFEGGHMTSHELPSLVATVSFTEQILPTTTAPREDYTTSQPPDLMGPEHSASASHGGHMTSGLESTFIFTVPASDLEALPGVTSNGISEQATPTATMSVFYSMPVDSTIPSSAHYDSMVPSSAHSSPAHSSPTPVQTGDISSTAASSVGATTTEQSLEPTSTLVPRLTSTWSSVPNLTTITNSIPEVLVSQTVLDGSTPVPSGPPTPPGAGAGKFNYMVILYVVPPIGAVLLCVVIITVLLCCRRYRRIYRIYRYRQQLVPLTDMDGSDESDDGSIDDRDPTFTVPLHVHSTSLTNRPVLAFDESS